ncbi:MAG: Gfo/Idh/MocA family oxidoreductase [Pirellula sp.]|jgi:predicted dehydrogenase|nr:Gfo/Idh/MocA family oxidoreductase [Pirellula sp.]
MNRKYSSQAAVVGTGFIGPVHIEGLQRAGVTVRGVLGSNVSKSAETAKRFGIEKAYGSFDELLCDDSVSVVHLTSPNRYHFEQAAATLRSGKHVLCEKPLAMNSVESGRLVQLAKETGLHAGVNYNVRFYPICVQAREMIESGELGEIYHVTGEYVQDWLLMPTDFNWRVLSSEGGPLRAVADIGTHWLDLVQSITGLDVEAVLADLQTVHPVRQRPAGGVETFSGMKKQPVDLHDVTIDTEDSGNILLRFGGGERGVLHVSQVTAGQKNSIRFQIAGRKKSLSWNSIHPDELWIGNRGTANQILLRDPSLLHTRAAMHAQYPGGHNEGFPDTFKQLFRSFYNSVEGHAEPFAPYPTFEEGHREIMLCEAILNSAKHERWIKVENGVA